MGTDKALLEVDGRPLVSTVAAALRAAGAERVLAVGGDLDALDALGLDTVADDHPGQGPLAGILTALGATAGPVVVVLACDLPDVSADGIRAVLGALGEADVAAPWHDGRHEFLHAAYTRAAESPLAEAFDAGERSVHRAAEGLDIASVVGLRAAWLADVDGPGDLHRR